MFETAYQEARNYTWPLVISLRTATGTVESGMATVIVLNDEGWMLTAAHVVQSSLKLQVDLTSMQSLETERQKIIDGPGDEKRKRQKTNRLQPDPSWLTNVSYWWGQDGVEVDEMVGYPDVDVLLVKLRNLDTSGVGGFPRFKDPAAMSPGASLVKIGYPFHSIKSTFDDTKGSFSLEPGALPAPLFPIEGIFTRNVI